MDIRLQSLTLWVRQTPGFEQAVAEPVSGDASFRRYFRVVRTEPDGSASPFIVMDAPPEHEDCEPFVAIARHWYRQGIRVPAIVRQDLDQGFLLLEDFGDRLMLSELNQDNADALYRGALAELVKIQQLAAPENYPLPPYDKELLDREMALFPDWLLEKYLDMPLNNADRALLDTTFAFLRESALAQPEVTVHRDYHSRNLLVLADTPPPGVIDFQDAVTGPITYDVVSLLRDCYIRWPEQQVEQWLEYFRKLSLEAGLHRADRETFRQWFELTGMQRHLKAAGIFARLAIRDGKQGYLADIPRTLGYLRDAASRQPALRSFHQWLIEALIPVVEQRIGPVPGEEQTHP